jgi:hypothetical protein
MNARLAHLLVRLYPRAWRERYGAEFEALLQNSPGDLRTSANVICSAVYEHIFSTQGGNMDRPSRSFGVIVARPSAFLPLAMSLTALVVLGCAALAGGLVPHADEGTAAHLWQILMGGQMPVLAFFAIKWLPRAPKQALYVLAIQAGAALAAMAPVYFLHL